MHTCIYQWRQPDISETKHVENIIVYGSALKTNVDIYILIPTSPYAYYNACVYEHIHPKDAHMNEHMYI